MICSGVMIPADSGHSNNHLQKSYRGKYPFKIGTTSFIYPDHYTEKYTPVGPLSG